MLFCICFCFLLESHLYRFVSMCALGSRGRPHTLCSGLHAKDQEERGIGMEELTSFWDAAQLLLPSEYIARMFFSATASQMQPVFFLLSASPITPSLVLQLARLLTEWQMGRVCSPLPNFFQLSLRLEILIMVSLPFDEGAPATTGFALDKNEAVETVVET